MIKFEFTNIECCSCGIQIGVTQEYADKIRGNKQQFFCPNGHAQHFTGESDAQRIARLKKESENKQTIIDNLEKQIIALKKPKGRGRPRKS